jgi:hypothetical protein
MRMLQPGLDSIAFHLFAVEKDLKNKTKKYFKRKKEKRDSNT